MSSRLRSRSAHGQTGLQWYLREINQTPLLSQEEERVLALQIAQGDPEARDLMVRANLRLVVNMARNYHDKRLHLEDLIEEGNLGLMRAVEGFDPNMSVRFSTYASYWIKQSIRRAVMNQGKAIRLPAYMVTLLSKWRRASAALADSLGRQPTSEEVGRALKLSTKKIGIVDQALKVNNLSLQLESGADEGMMLDELLTDDRSRAPDEMIIEADEMSRVFERMVHLDPREREVIRLRYGIGVENALTLREIGERLNLTRERVRQLERAARRKLTDSGHLDGVV